jgi:hypothetical protein
MKGEFMPVIIQDLNERLSNRQLCVYLDEKLILCDNNSINMKKIL